MRAEQPVALALALQTPAAEQTPAAGKPARDHVNEILSRPLYQRWKLRQARGESAHKEQNQSWIQRFLRELLDDIGNAIERFFKWLGSKMPRGNIGPVGGGGAWLAMLAVLKMLGWLVLAVIVVFLVIVAMRLYREGKWGRRKDRVLSREQVSVALEEGEALALGSPQWIAEAARLAEEGQFRAVYRALYLALLSGLHESGRIEFRKTRTNWTYVRRFKGPDAERESFSRLTWIFDEAWYGLRPPADAKIDQIRQEVTQLVGERG